MLQDLYWKFPKSMNSYHTNILLIDGVITGESLVLMKGPIYSQLSIGPTWTTTGMKHEIESQNKSPGTKLVQL